MPRRFQTKQQLAFTVPGKPLCSGMYGRRPAAEKKTGGRAAYINMVRLCAKSAIMEQGWEMPKELEAVYIVITIYCLPGRGYQHRGHKHELALQNKVLAVRNPMLISFNKAIIAALKGILFAQEKQIVAMLTVKKFSADPRVEILVGKPQNLWELSNDLRNA